jgi:hypothetical protein
MNIDLTEEEREFLEVICVKAKNSFHKNILNGHKFTDFPNHLKKVTAILQKLQKETKK